MEPAAPVPAATPPAAAVPTADGSLSVFSERYGEWYASQHGAVRQSRTVFLEGSAACLHPAPRVLEVGFGLGLNFRTTLADVTGRGVPLNYLAFEAFPLAASDLVGVAGDEAHPLWRALLHAWDAGQQAGHLSVQHGPHRLRLWFADITAALLPPQWADAIYLDGFSPARNPEVWTPEFLARLADSLAPGGRLATYSAAGAVRRSLIAAGLRVERRRGRAAGLVGKREFLVACKP
ncbi:tRNA (5-methylaminomethyl-2-thiouridine)(34)-methyltransferase MnmD [Deinococcus rubellus]|uniref:tRNA (5-methylaminomethyl-2-thiouridine)(34)-methyltransferase MnmD n=1 Tax=Deinococcus rubellus TaxID=1889240 RepID=A0ABY5YFM0_9DEIO|nr:tRNA (5-methylaminomethyl-2-thiouridine)(34)-methyltransferase MnmD [Deinococcus rubellus]UWX63598.1 tRNA (5-methylaminomethyl-2-thiouridine)(34)-methyltransferase MnmD [Deinococcus rubellus]